MLHSLVHRPNPRFELNCVVPAKCMHAPYVQQLARRAIRLARVKHQSALKPRHTLHHLRKLADRYILARTDIHQGRISLIQKAPIAVLGQI